MRTAFKTKHLIYPQPVLMIATYNGDGTPNLMNAAWGGISGEDKITVCVDRSHRTAENVVARKAFTVSMATVGTAVACDYVGIVSGNDVPDKFAKAGFHADRSEIVDAPIVRELPMVLECRMVSYDGETEILVGEIVRASADESVLTDGKVDPAKLKPITYDPCNHRYLALGETVGSAFSDGMKLK